MFHKVVSPGISWVVPGIDMLTTKVDMRIRSTSFSAEKTLTKESIKERGALMVVPSGMAESLNTGMIGMAAAGFKHHDGDA